MTEHYQEFEDKVKTLNTIGQVRSLLHWDQQVMMPEEGIKARSRQNSELAKIYHQKITEDRLGELIQVIDSGELEKEQKANLREVGREHERAVKVPEELEEKISEKQSTTVSKWEIAKEEEDFSIVAPHLGDLVELKRRYADEIDSSREPYQVLFDDFEPYIDFETMERIMEKLKRELTDLVEEIREADDMDGEALSGDFPEEGQREISERVVDLLGFDRDRGRFDVSTHPFTSEGNTYDTRMTTRFDEENLAESISATVHETGHALYGQGLPDELFATHAGKARDFSVHESQSRLWENHVGKSVEFWENILPELKEIFPEQMEDVSPEDCYRAINRVDPENLIRINADEVTYHLHIIIRFELERKLINGELEVEDLPEEWNRRYEKYLGVEPGNDAEGVMQDIHWYQGSFGYFTTYSLGSVLAAQIYRKAEEEIENLDEKIREGELSPLREWLREEIHQKGCIYRTGELVEQATGEQPTADYFLEYIRQKYEDLYSL
ncbi:MAG: carboxypeptidase M32 [Candidatus Nanohaloarchaea archaeon]